jgi:hypothetical protein
MRHTQWIAALVLTVVFTGCKGKDTKNETKNQQCAAGDTAEVCKAFQECLRSDTSAEVCRMGEQDASQPRKDLSPAYGGAADALQDKPAQKPARPQQKH